MTTPDALLAEARAAGVERLDAQLLVAHALGRPRAWVVAHGGDAIDGAAALAVRALLARRAAGEPLAYLVGTKEFHGLALRVTPEVLVPRPDTETLVDWALELLAGPLGAIAAPAVIDLGTGSGAIALALKAACSRAHVLATDASTAALEVARGNAAALGLDVAFAHGDWWAAAGERRFDLAVSNPPYVEAGDPHLAALAHEPIGALASGADGLDAIRAIVAGAPARLARGGWLLLEHGFAQHEAIAALLGAAGFEAIAMRRDLAGHPRCTGGRRPA